MNKKKPSSLKLRLTRSFLFLMCGMFIVYAVIFNVVGIVSKITANNYKILMIQTQGVADRIAEIFREAAFSASELAEFTENAVEEYQNKSGLDWKDIDGNPDALNAVYGDIARFYIDAAARGHTTGVFLYLDAMYPEADASGYMSALYIRTGSVRTTGAAKYLSLSLYMGLPDIVGGTINADPFSPYYPKDASGSEFILETMDNARKIPDMISRADLGRWSSFYTLGDDKIITYSEPLYDRDGNVIGVCGIELSAEYLVSLVPNADLPYAESEYVIGDIRPDGDSRYFHAQHLLSNGLHAGKAIGQTAVLVPDKRADGTGMNSYGMEILDNDGKYTVFSSDLNLYGESSVYYGSGYSVAGIVESGELHSLGSFVSTVNFAAVLAAFIILGGGIFLYCHNLSLNIEKLAGQVSSLGAGKKIAVGRINVREIDDLAKSFEELSVKLIKNARHLSDVAGLVGVTIAAVEITDGKVSFSDILYDVFSVPKDDGDQSETDGLAVLPVDRWEEKFPVFMKCGDLAKSAGGGSVDDEFEFNGKWYRVRYVCDKDNGANVYATMIEITKEIEDRRRFEFERDFDPLTGILSRSSYRAKIQQKIDADPSSVGAMVFCDLDGLKAVNDTYGHKAGDIYIQTTAVALSGFEKYGGIVARLAGDEFIVYLHGFTSKSEISKILKAELNEVKQSRADISTNGEDIKIRLSAGVAFYPENSSVVDDLVKYADFAMNELKRSSKGGIRNFDPDSFERGSKLMAKQNYLDIFLEQRRLKFAFQPVVEVATGEIFGYKALMRPLIRDVQSPDMLLQAAAKQGKLYNVEKLVLETIFDWIRRNSVMINDRKIFFNVIGAQNCHPDDWNNFVNLNSVYFKSVICEITDAEAGKIDEIVKKVERLRDKSAAVSLNSNVGKDRIQRIVPEIIKISKNIISGIDTDEEKQREFENAVVFARENNAEVVAEGVESAEELDKVIMLGADYVQGFAIAMPSYDMFDVPDKIKVLIKDIHTKYQK